MQGKDKEMKGEKGERIGKIANFLHHSRESSSEMRVGSRSPSKSTEQ